MTEVAWAAYEADNARANADTHPARAGLGERSGEQGMCATCGSPFEHNALGRRRKYCRVCSPPKGERHRERRTSDRRRDVATGKFLPELPEVRPAGRYLPRSECHG